jgi:hypothetical protein
MISAFLTAVSLLVGGPAFSRTWHIAPGGTGDAPTIQAGIDSAAAGDTLLLADGEFSGQGNRNIDFGGKAIVLTSEPGRATINPRYPEDTEPRRGFIFQSGEGREAIVRDISVIFAHADTGSAVLCTGGSSPTFINCWFDGCGDYPIPNLTCGGGMACLSGSSPRLVDCEFYEDQATYGGGLYCESSTPSLEGVKFIDGMALSGSGLYCIGGYPSLVGCEFAGGVAPDSGGVVYLRGASAVFEECSIMAASSDRGGGICVVGAHDAASVFLFDCSLCDNWGGIAGGAAYFTDGHGNSELNLIRCTVAYNVSWGGSGLALEGWGITQLENTIVAFNERSAAVVCPEHGWLNSECSDIYGNEGGDWVGCLAGAADTDGNFSADPRFCKPPGPLVCNLTVEDCSPCLPGNHPDGYDCNFVIGASGAGCQCGATSVPATWGAIKAMYR